MRRRDPAAEGAHGPASSVSRSGDAANPTLRLTVPVTVGVSPPHHRNCFLFPHEVSESIMDLGQEKETYSVPSETRKQHQPFLEVCELSQWVQGPQNHGEETGVP